MSDQLSPEARRAGLVDRALADGKELEEALALAARAEGFIVGDLTPAQVLGAQLALPPPDKRSAVDGQPSAVSHQPSAKNTGPKPGAKAREPTRKWSRWSAEDIAYLKQAWAAGVFIEEITARLEGRLARTIQSKVRKLGLKRSPEFRSAVSQINVRRRYEREPRSKDPSQKDLHGLDTAFAAVMDQVVAWLGSERGEAVALDDQTGGYLFRGDNLTAHQLVAQANAVRHRLGKPLFALPDADPPSAPGMGTAAALVVEAAP